MQGTPSSVAPGLTPSAINHSQSPLLNPSLRTTLRRDPGTEAEVNSLKNQVFQASIPPGQPAQPLPGALGIPIYITGVPSIPLPSPPLPYPLQGKVRATPPSPPLPYPLQGTVRATPPPHPLPYPLQGVVRATPPSPPLPYPLQGTVRATPPPHPLPYPLQGVVRATPPSPPLPYPLQGTVRATPPPHPHFLSSPQPPMLLSPQGRVWDYFKTRQEPPLSLVNHPQHLMQPRMTPPVTYPLIPRNLSQAPVPPQAGQKRPALPSSHSTNSPQLKEEPHPLESPQKKARLDPFKETEKKGGQAEKKEFYKKAQLALQRFQDAFSDLLPTQDSNKEEEKSYLLASDVEEIKECREMETEGVEKEEISTFYSISDLPEELFQMILSLQDKKEDIKSVASVCHQFSERTVAFFGRGEYGSNVFKDYKISRASSNFNSNSKIDPQIFSLNQIGLSQDQAPDLYWIKGNLIAVSSKGFKSKISIFKSQTSTQPIELDLGIVWMKELGNNKLLLMIGDQGSQDTLIIYDFSKRKILGIFFNSSLSTLSDQEILLERGQKLLLVNLKGEKIKVTEWSNIPESGTNRQLLSENRVIMNCKRGLKIFDFSCKKIFPIPNSLYKNPHLFENPKMTKKVRVVNEKEIIVQAGTIPTLYKIALPKNLENEKEFSMEELDLKTFLLGPTNDPNHILGPMTLDRVRQLLWIPTQQSIHQSNGILKIDLNNFSFYNFYCHDNVKMTSGGKIEIMGNTLFRTGSKLIQVWEIKDASLNFCYSTPFHQTRVYNKEMTAFACYSKSKKIAKVKDYSA